MLSKGPSGHKHPGAPWGLCELSLLHPPHYRGARGGLTHPIAALGVRAPLTDGGQITCYSCKVLSAALSSNHMVLLSYTCIEQCNCNGFDDLKSLLKNCASKLPEIPFFPKYTCLALIWATLCQNLWDSSPSLDVRETPFSCKRLFKIHCPTRYRRSLFFFKKKKKRGGASCKC